MTRVFSCSGVLSYQDALACRDIAETRTDQPHGMRAVMRVPGGEYSETTGNYWVVYELRGCVTGADRESTHYQGSFWKGRECAEALHRMTGQQYTMEPVNTMSYRVLSKP